VNQQLVLCEVQGAVRVLTMNRPESRNALNTDLISALHNALMLADRDTSVRAVVLTGADPAFCAGLDLKQVQRDGSAFHAAVTVTSASLEQFTRWRVAPRLNRSDAVDCRIELSISGARQTMPLFVR
jgi:enoyl-CoA hydratase/carnithine racemase